VGKRQVFKPHSRLYKHAAKRTDTAPERIVHASAGWMDVQGAMYAGMRGAWVNRSDRPEGIQVFESKPDEVSADFHELADTLDA
jgi:2-haloacid dehalogenase